MRVRRVGIAAQRVDDEQVDTLKEIDHFDGKLRKISGICDSMGTVAEDQPARLDRPVRHFDGRNLDRADRLMIVQVDRSEEHTSALQSLMRISYAVFCLR